MEDPLTEEILRGAFKGKDLIKITVEAAKRAANKHLYFEALDTPATSRTASKARNSPRRLPATRRES